MKMAEPRKQQPIVHHVIQPVLMPSTLAPGSPYSMPGIAPRFPSLLKNPPSSLLEP